MAVLLTLLLIAAIAGLAVLAFHAVQLRGQSVRLANDLAAQRARYDHDIKLWNDYAEAAKAQYQGLVNKHNEDLKRVNEIFSVLKAENQNLHKWKGMADAEVKAAEMLRTAQTALAKATAEANELLSNSQQRAAAIVADANGKAAAQMAEANKGASATTAEAREKAKALKDEAQAMLDSATSHAAKIIETANKKAEDIAGSAYEAMKNAALYERTAKAMKNLIEGYGDQYIVPEQSLLDNLAEDFSHAQAGQELKRARERTRVMVRNGTAATCDYVEVTRRETAVNFVVDAFNGKVDSILSRVKHDNEGKLEQEIRDAFTVVNYNGRAFRDARVNEEYLAARLDELKWASVAQQLAIQEREEQRRIKEQIREEDRARREFERAIREAAKEEEMLRKAMEKAQKQMEQASAEQKSKYEQQLQEFAERLKQAEERNQRAVSMAQQTRRGHVYIISNVGSFGEDVYKIGLTRRLEPLERIRELGDSSVPFEFDVHAMIFSEDAPALEKQLHNHFVLMQVNKVNHRKEFFRVCIKHVREELDKLGLTAKWTMTAEAKEYRETLAIEEAIKDKPAMREAWIKRQLQLEIAENDAPELEPVGAAPE
jgi:hypothetical protein